MSIAFKENISLKPFNSFGLDTSAKLLCEVHSVEDVQELLGTPEFKKNRHLILGGGSNVLLTQNFDGLVILNRIKGIEVMDESPEQITVRSGAGETWHHLVLWAVEENLGGIENLSLIPGTVGAAPMQNIGAYGVEIKETFEQLEAVNLQTGAVRTFYMEECDFGYRSSVFKESMKGKYLITSVTFKLNRKPTFNTSYGAIGQTLKDQGVEKLSVRTISEAVCSIRASKLPDPAKIGNSGSFFKNPVIEATEFDRLKVKFPEVVGYPLENGQVKVAAGWLIEQAGWKGKRQGGAGVHDRQALVLVNHGGAKGREIWALAEAIQKDVKEKFNILLQPEVNVI